MHFDIDSHTICIGLAGSHAYGTSRPGSDIDLRGVLIPPREVRESYFRNFEQWAPQEPQRGPWGPNSKLAIERLETHPSTSESYAEALREGLDVCIYSLTKFVRLAAACNPSILELLFIQEQDILFLTPAWIALRRHRDLFLSKRVKYTYSGYAISQLKKIESHRGWLLNPPKEKPTRAGFGLPETSTVSPRESTEIEKEISKRISRWCLTDGFDDLLIGATADALRLRMREFHSSILKLPKEEVDDVLYVAAAQDVGASTQLLENLKRERAYRQARNHWKQYLKWKENRNPDRSRMEEKYGYDCKHAAHLIRLLRTGLEILEGKGLQVKRDDHKELSEIRNGKWTYDQLIAETESLRENFDKANALSDLPSKVDANQIDEVLFEILTAYR